MRWLAFVACLALAATFAWRTDASYDTGFHLATGRWILAHRSWPQLDPFTFTVPDHPYLTMHGFFQIALALADRAGADVGTGLLRMLLVLGAFGLCWATCRLRGVSSPSLLLAGFAIAIAASEVRFSLRPELASLLFLAATVHLLERYRLRRDPRWLWGVPLVQWLWTNSHALAPLGVAVTGLFAASAFLDPATRRDRAPVAAFLASGVALFVNPYGIRGVAFDLDLVTRLRPENAFARSIIELASPFSREFAGLKPILAYEALFAVTLLVFALDRLAPVSQRTASSRSAPRTGARGRVTASRSDTHRPRESRTTLFDLALVLLFAVLSARSVRNLPLFALAVLPPVLDGLEGQRRRLTPAVAARLRWGLWLFAAGMVAIPIAQIVSGAWYIDDHRAEAFGIGPAPGMLPTRTLDYIERHHLRGPIFNHLNFGGALIGRLWPRERVFIDGRLEVMGEPFFRAWQRIERGTDWDAMVARYDPHLALVPNAELPLLRRLGHDPRWTLVEWDGAAALFLRPLSADDSVLASEATARRAALARPDDPFAAPPPARPAPSLWTRWLARRRYPGVTWGEANALYGIGDFSAARREFHRALSESDRDDVPLLLALAATDEHCDRPGEALRWYRRVLELEPANSMALERVESLRGASPP